MSNIYVATKVWIGQFLESLCDKSPLDAEYYLPPGMTKSLMHENYVREIERSAFGYTAFKYDYFRKTLKKEYPFVHKAKDTFLAKCDLCVQWADPKTKKLAQLEYALLRQKYMDHLRLQAVSFYQYMST